MALVILTGFPCSGKTTFAQLLKQEVERLIPEKKVFIVNEESELPDESKTHCYLNSIQEKATRSAIRSAVAHKISADAVVIADSSNYIKGFRYELYCASRTFRIPHCAVWIECPESISDNWNSLREKGYSAELMTELRKRFEEPNENNRWDKPLFRVNMSPLSNLTDPEKSTNSSSLSSPTGEAETPLVKVPLEPQPVKKSSWKPKGKSRNQSTVSAICQSSADSTMSTPSSVFLSFSGTERKNESSLLGDDKMVAIAKIIEYIQTAVPPVPHASTVNTSHASADMLYELDRISTLIVNDILAHQSSTFGQEDIPIIFPSYNRSLCFHRIVAAAELLRHRRQYVKVNSRHPPASPEDIGASFVDFLASQI